MLSITLSVCDCATFAHDQRNCAHEFLFVLYIEIVKISERNLPIIRPITEIGIYLQLLIVLVNVNIYLVIYLY